MIQDQNRAMTEGDWVERYYPDTDWERAADDAWYCRWCHHEIGCGHELDCPRYAGTEIG
jgi:hypothetical protein